MRPGRRPVPRPATGYRPAPVRRSRTDVLYPAPVLPRPLITDTATAGPIQPSFRRRPESRTPPAAAPPVQTGPRVRRPIKRCTGNRPAPVRRNQRGRPYPATSAPAESSDPPSKPRPSFRRGRNQELKPAPARSRRRLFTQKAAALVRLAAREVPPGASRLQCPPSSTMRPWSITTNANGGQAVGDRHHSAFAQAGTGSPGSPTRPRIERAGRFIEQQNRRVLSITLAIAMRWRCPPRA